jgi:hypothetical protein
MKISELNDDDILNFLMVSEFEGDYSPSELKFLLVKWRYFYRLFQGKNEQTRTQLEDTISKLEEEIKIKSKCEYDLQVDNANKQNTIDQMKKRKLTFKERFSGNIILEEEKNRKK